MIINSYKIADFFCSGGGFSEEFHNLVPDTEIIIRSIPYLYSLGSKCLA